MLANSSSRSSVVVAAPSVDATIHLEGGQTGEPGMLLPGFI